MVAMGKGPVLVVRLGQAQNEDAATVLEEEGEEIEE